MCFKMKKEIVNLLIIEWYNNQDLSVLKDYSVNTRFRLLDFEDIFIVKYDMKKRFQRYWTQIKRFNPKKYKLYFDFIKNCFFKKSYVFSQDCVRKLNVMSLTFEQYKHTIKKNHIRGVILHREDPWLNNLILFSKKLNLKVIILNKEHVYEIDEEARGYAKNLPFRCDLMIVGGESGKLFWLAAMGADSNKIKITGVPRFDRYCEKSFVPRKIFCKLVGLDPKKKIIFFPSLSSRCTQRQFFVNKKLLNKIYEPTDLEYAWPMKTYYNQDISQFKEEELKVLYNVARKHPDIQILIKLHPDMQPNSQDCTKHELFAIKRTLKNFVGITSYDVRIDPRDIINHSYLTVGYNSTMLLEAIMAKRSLIQTKWGCVKHIPGIPLYEWHCCDRAKTPAELKKKLLGICKSGEDLKKYEKGREKIIKYYFFKQDGKACERVFKEIDKLFS